MKIDIAEFVAKCTKMPASKSWTPKALRFSSEYRNSGMEILED